MQLGEIFKNIRKTEVRTLRPLTVMSTNSLSQAPLQFLRVARTVVNSDDHDFLQANNEVDAVREKNHARFADGSRDSGKLFGIGSDALKDQVYLCFKACSQSRFPTLIPRDVFIKFMPCKRLEADGSAHGQPCFFFKSARTSSQGMQSSGFFRASSARRSNSAINSGDSSGSRSSKRASAISRRSSGRNSRALAKISVALIGRSITETHAADKCPTVLNSSP